jgi:hypothetical protein
VLGDIGLRGDFRIECMLGDVEVGDGFRKECVLGDGLRDGFRRELVLGDGLRDGFHREWVLGERIGWYAGGGWWIHCVCCGTSRSRISMAT